MSQNLQKWAKYVTFFKCISPLLHVKKFLLKKVIIGKLTGSTELFVHSFMPILPGGLLRWKRWIQAWQKCFSWQTSELSGSIADQPDWSPYSLLWSVYLNVPI